MTRTKLPISAVVTTHDEAHQLGSCLDSIQFCEELLVVDLESSDDSAAVAVAHGARVIEHEVVPAVEQIRFELIDSIRHDWLLTIDPDEQLSPSLQEEIYTTFPELPDTVAMVSVPSQYYFGRRPLRGTVWGGIGERRLLIHRRRATLSPDVHADVSVHAGYSQISLPFRGDNLSHHYWMTDYSEWIGKHRRYIHEEARVRAERGERATIAGTAIATANALYFSLVTRRGYRDGVTGVLLSAFWAWYVGRTQWRLRKLTR